MSESNEKEVCLISVGDENEAEVIRSLLESQGIIALIKHRGSGQYLNIIMGM